ncbi:MAG TPA: PH domain-containing protein [Methanocorpusculum sp.]|nr:PH domain-containing protein [Methanocorpusculum sp.]
MDKNDLFSDVPPLKKCDGCNLFFEEGELKQCHACGKYFCSECQKTHNCRTATQSPVEKAVPVSNIDNTAALQHTESVNHATKKENDEFVIKLHGSMFIFPVIVLILGLILLVIFAPVGLVVLIIGIIILISRVIKFNSYYIKITPQGISICDTFLNKGDTNIRLNKIDGIDVSAKVSDRLLGRGKIVIYSVGGRKIFFGPIGKPYQNKDRILDLIDKYSE